MKKVGKIAGAIVIAMALAGCSSQAADNSASGEYGSITITSAENDGRALVNGEIKSAEVVVSGNGFEDIKAENVTLGTDGSGTASIDKIPAGKNLVVSVSSNITGGVIRAVIPSLSAGENKNVTVNWDTTAVGSVYYKLIKNGVDVSSIAESSFSEYIPAGVHASLVDAAALATDIKANTLSSSKNYKLSTGTAILTVYGYNGKSVNIADPSSTAQNCSSDSATLTFNNVYPGSWNVYAGTEKIGKITVSSGKTTTVTFGTDPNKVIIFVASSSAPKIWVWQESGGQTDGEQLLNCSYDERPTMTAATSAYMNNPSGWYMLDLSSYNYTTGVNFCFKLDEGADIESGKSATFWYNENWEEGKKFVDKDPTIYVDPNDVTLSAISVTGASVSVSGAASYSVTSKGSSDSGSILVSATPVSSTANVVVNPSEAQTIADGKSKEFKIIVTNGTGSATYTVIVTYEKQENGTYYWTNKNGYGVNKTISSFSDWTTDMIIVQGAANDDPRAFRGYHEKAVDFYALYAAYDDTNIYLMVEMPSIDNRDLTSKEWQFALDENLGMGFGINTGKGIPGDGEMDEGTTIWHAEKFYSITEKIDTMLMFHPAEYGTPGLFKTKSDGKFSYDAEYCLKWSEYGIVTSKDIVLVSKTLYGRSNNYGLTMTEYLEKTDYVDMLTDPDKTDVSGYKYQITIPYKALGIDKAYLTSTGISVMTFSTFGTSMMDALPWCQNLIDVAKDEYHIPDNTSAEKEDFDEYDVPLARIGHQ